MPEPEPAADAVAPVAARRPITRTHHGDVVTDDYEWLRDADDPAVVAHLEAEDAWTRARTAHLRPLRERLFAEIKGRTLETDLSAPVRLGASWYYTRTVEGQAYAVHARVPVSGTAGGAAGWEPPTLEPGVAPEGEQVLLDENALAQGHDFFALGGAEVSADERLLAYQVDTQGDERYTLRLRDLATGVDLPDEIEQTSPGVALTPDGAHVFYTTVDDAWRPSRVWRHRIGGPVADDVLVADEPDERFWVGVGLSRSRRFVQIELASKLTSEVRLTPADEATTPPFVVWPRREGVEYTVEDAAGHLLVLHNDGAQDFELAAVELGPREGWERPGAFAPERSFVVVPHESGTRLEAVDAFARHAVLSYRREATARVAVADLEALLAAGRAGKAGQWREVSTGQALETVALDASPLPDQPTVRVVVESFTTPRAVYDHVLATGEMLLRKRQPVLGGYDPDDYAQRREWAIAPDGARVPVSLVWRRDAVDVDGAPQAPAPLLLYGYGAYEYSLDPWFSVPRLSLLDRGVVFAVAHVRGGGELGRRWYDEGKLLAKRHTFTDFIAVARRLVEVGWTTPDRMAGEGGSAGGLLIGAVVNLAPELFAGVHAAVPFVDPLTSILDPSLPLTVTEWEEWGDPLHDPEAYAYIRGYAPYENVPPGPDGAAHYPRILATTSLHDTRVLFVEPAKWVARLRAAGAPALLRVEMAAGHGGVSGRYARWEQIAEENAWLLDVLGAADLDPHDARP
ncbi:S9 family peptidase [Xylanimonas ulmi]|uniref:Oligopeptidase B n=1 Tax=Xylanimonas ulmi TaxID=228973 RepID=A0A4Q7M965_9MICO|nr:S9 family peptidase [Xylanibacterium ulmi]RZS62739.1 oligopeptidase B [Xylanibacterium ulmi]